MKRLYVLVLTEVSKILQWFRGDKLHGITAPVEPAYQRLLRVLSIGPPRIERLRAKPPAPASNNHDSDEFHIVRR